MAKKTKVKWKRLFICVFCAYAVISLVCGFGEIYTLKEQQAQLDIQIEEALIEQEELKEQVEIMSQPQEKERIAREQLGYVLPGEIVMKKIEDAD